MKKPTAIALTWILLCGISNAVECRLDHATYSEVQSGIVLAFHPRTPDAAALTTAAFDLQLPHMKPRFAGEITWTSGKNARPDASIRRPCAEDPTASYQEACWLWFGNAYVVGNETVGLIDDAEMAAPQAILFADFGRSVMFDESFVRANPDALVLDLFTLSACTP